VTVTSEVTVTWQHKRLLTCVRMESSWIRYLEFSLVFNRGRPRIPYKNRGRQVRREWGGGKVRGAEESLYWTSLAYQRVLTIMNDCIA
jgi:hypothetical protein